MHHLKLPVRDLAASRAWYQTRLGYELELEFVEDGEVRGVSLRHPRGGPRLALRLDPERAAATSGFDLFAVGVPDRAALDELAEALTALGEQHGGVRAATLGWFVAGTHDPDGYEVRFYTTDGVVPVAD